MSLRSFAILFAFVSGIAVIIVADAAQSYHDADVASTRTTAYAAGLGDGAARAEQRQNAKAPTVVANFAQGFCSGTLAVSMFDSSMGVSQADIDGWATKQHNCAGVRYLGSVHNDRDNSIDFIYVVDENGITAWYVFTFGPNGKVTGIQ